MIHVNDQLSIPESEIDFSASRSGGPGGQHANTSSTRVTLEFDVDGSPSLTDAQRDRIHRRLRNRINRQGVLRITAQDERSQAANKRLAMQRLTELLRDALYVPPRRKVTRTPRGADERRLEQKKRHGEKKRRRAWRPTRHDF